MTLLKCLLSLRGWLWNTPRELQLQSLHCIGPVVCCKVVGNRVSTALDTANLKCVEADSLLRLQVDSRVLADFPQLRQQDEHSPGSGTTLFLGAEWFHR